MPSYMASFLALHKSFTNHVPKLCECARPRTLNLPKKKSFSVALKACSLETALRNILHLTAS